VPHEPALITTIAAAFALILGFRLRLPALVGYMLAA
jgi:predicted Kef-type K+ transport protein